MIVGQHCPEAAHSYRWNGDTKVRNVSFQKSTNESLTPCHAVFIQFGKKRARKSAAQPESFPRIRTCLLEVKGREFNKFPSSGKSLRDILHNLRGSASKDEKTSLVFRAIYKHTQNLEELRHLLDLVKNGNSLKGTQYELRILQASYIRLRFEI